MTRRTLWTTLLAVLGLLALASLAPVHGPRLLAWVAGVPWAALVAALAERAITLPPAFGVALGAGTGVLIFAMLLWRRRRPPADGDNPAAPAFAVHLDTALRAPVPHGGARRREAEALARAGMPAEEIARTTRLSRDAVRAVMAAIAAAERHELPPRDAPVGAG